MTRWSLQVAVFPVSLAVTSSIVVGAPAGVGDLVCPPQTQYKRIELKEQGVFSETCRDDRGVRQGTYRFRRSSDGSVEVEGTYLDSKPEGAERSYNAEGELLYTTIYSRGVQGETTFTRAGWAAVANLANEQLKHAGKNVLVSASESGGLLVEHTTSITLSERSAEFSSRIRREFRPLMCGLLTRNPQLQSVDLLLRWSDGTVASIEKFRAVQCTSPESPGR